MILQKNESSCNSLGKMSEDTIYCCYYCNGTVNLEDLLKIDEKFKRMDPEDHEFILDNLPRSTKPREAPFIHRSDLGYDVLNICLQCFRKAKHQ